MHFLVIILAFCLGTSACASTLTRTFSVEVTDVSTVGTNLTSVSVGDFLKFSITVDTTVPNGLIGSTTIVIYDGAVSAMSLENVASFTTVGTASSVVIQNGSVKNALAYTDGYNATIQDVSQGGPTSELIFDAARITGDPNDDYVTSLSLNQFPDITIPVTSGPIVRFSDYITGLSIQAKIGAPLPAVPLPAAGRMLLASSGALGAIRRNRV